MMMSCQPKNNQQKNDIKLTKQKQSIEEAHRNKLSQELLHTHSTTLETR